MEFSLILLTYNQDINRILLTLNSMIKQDFQDYEIIISDDGSEDNHFLQIEKFFQEKGFAEYQLIPHDENQGTVCNLISAIECAKGRYIKDFGPGDLFYDQYSLGKLHQYFLAEKCEICMGRYVSYYINDSGEVSYSNYLRPIDIDAYVSKNLNRVKKNLALYADHIPGVCLAGKREIFLEYMYRIKESVVYVEDIFQVLFAIDGKSIRLCNEYLYLYEVNVGISMSSNKQFGELLKKDITNFYNMLDEQFPDLKLLKKRKKLLFLYKIDNLYLRTLVRLIFNPSSLEHIFWYVMQRLKTKQSYNSSFLDANN